MNLNGEARQARSATVRGQSNASRVCITAEALTAMRSFLAWTVDMSQSFRRSGQLRGASDLGTFSPIDCRSKVGALRARLSAFIEHSSET
jgi:hypothetical protein